MKLRRLVYVFVCAVPVAVSFLVVVPQHCQPRTRVRGVITLQGGSGPRRGGGSFRRNDGGRPRGTDGRSEYGRDRRMKRRRVPEAQPSLDPEKRLASLNKKLNSIIELEELDDDDLNEEQRQKLQRKDSIREEISRLTKLIRKQDYVEEAATQRAQATTAADLNKDVVGGNIPRTLLKLLVYCRVSDRDTCNTLLELGKVKVNGVVVDDPVTLVDLVKDKIQFMDEPVSLPEHRLKHRLREVSPDEVTPIDPRQEVPKEYCAKIDGGLLIDLTREIEKSRGTYVDKSPYIVRKR